MLTKTIEVDGRDVKFRASAAIPRLYRIKFRRDMMIDLQELYKAYMKNQESGEEFGVADLTVFENAAYIMARHADPSGVPDDIDTWLDSFGIFSIYNVLPVILELWGLNLETQAESKKKLNEVAGK